MADMRAALVAIQELHTALLTGFSARSGPLYECTECGQAFPCDTRKLADEGLDRMARTNQGENK